MKAAVNGRLNLSVLDGWWAEGWTQDNGWGIPPINVQDPDRRDALEAELIFDTLEEETLPLYYSRNSDGYSSEWVRRCKRAMSSVVPRFNMRRTVYDYGQGVYYPRARHAKQLADHDFAGARLLADWKQRVRQAWSKVGLRLLADGPSEMPRGEALRLRIAADLNGLQPSDVRVEFVARRQLPEANFEVPPLASFGAKPPEGVWTVALGPTGEHESDGSAVYALDAHPAECGQFATEMRIYPWHELLTHPFEMGLMKRL
jgi:starch phosphorylase